ncbi:MAG: hypothetical protein K6D55_09070 [Prevotella sp.]|nr:hypothetical protein [Prevotella sp.]
MALLVASAISSKKGGPNRVARVVTWFFYAVFAITALFILFVAPFVVEGENKGVIFAVTGWSWLVVLMLVNGRLSARGWLERRVAWLSGERNASQMIEMRGSGKDKYFSQMIEMRGSGKDKYFWYTDPETEVSYAYQPSHKYFFIIRTMFTDPARHSKEYGERKYQFSARMQQTQLPVDISITDETESNTSFQVVVRMSKQVATKAHVIVVRDVVVHLAQDDYSQPLYVHYAYANAELYLETRYYTPKRAIVVGKGRSMTYIIPDNVDASLSSGLPKRLLQLLHDVYDHHRLMKVSADELTDAATFNGLWEQILMGKEMEPPADREPHD